MTRCLAIIVLLICLVGTAFGAHAADVKFPELTGRIVDNAQVLSAQTTAQLEQHLAAFEQQTGHQVVVVTLPEIGDNDIADYGYQLGRHWQIGQQGKNDGVIVLLVPSTRQVRIEVGYGLEGDLTDAASSVIINNVMIPLFKAGDMEAGLVQGTLAVMSVVSHDGQMAVRPAGKQHDNLMKYLFIAFIIFWIFARARGGRSSGIAPFILGSMLGSGRSSGGFGGFGGGGGSFGGGGASGRW